MAVHRRLGQAGRARGVEPQRPGVVAGRRARGVAARPRGEQVVEGVRGDPVGHREVTVADQHDVLDLGRGGHRLGHGPGELRGGHDRARAPESATIEASSRPVNIVESGTATRPARKAPRIVVSIGTSSAMTSTTRSSRCKPKRAQAGGDLPDAAVEVGVRPGRGGAHGRAVAATCLDLAGEQVVGGVEVPSVAAARSHVTHPPQVVGAALPAAVAPQRAVGSRGVGPTKIQFCQAVSRPKILVSRVSGPTKRWLASMPVRASGLSEARSSSTIRSSSSRSRSSRASVTSPTSSAAPRVERLADPGPGAARSSSWPQKRDSRRLSPLPIGSRPSLVGSARGGRGRRRGRRPPRRRRARTAGRRPGRAPRAAHRSSCPAPPRRPGCGW